MIILKTRASNLSHHHNLLKGVINYITPLANSYWEGSSHSTMDSDSTTMAKNEKVDNQKLFIDESHAKNYSDFRPTYPDNVFETIFNFCKAKTNGNVLAVAVDVGCGSGQSTLPLTRFFSRVIGCDVSQKQISNAPTDVPGLTFHVSTAEELSFIDDGCVDLITIGQALHWLQLDKFYSEVDRILKPGGSFVAYGYSTMSVDDPGVHEYLMHIYGVVLATSWGSDRKHVENKYSCLPSPYDSWLRNDDLVMEKDYSSEQLIGYLNSWSSVQTHSKQNPKTDLIGEIREKLSMICQQDGDGKGEKVFKLTWPVFMLMARKPERRNRWKGGLQRKAPVN